MQKLILITLLIALLTACTPLTAVPVSTPTLSVIQPVSDYAPLPADSGLTRGQAFLDSSDLLTMESYPLQFSLALKGNLPTPCHKLRVAINPPDANNKVIVDVYSVADPTAVCIQMLEPFEVNVPLGSYPSGHYTLWANGEQVAEFDSK